MKKNKDKILLADFTVCSHIKPPFSDKILCLFLFCALWSVFMVPKQHNASDVPRYHATSRNPLRF